MNTRYGRRGVIALAAITILTFALPLEGVAGPAAGTSVKTTVKPAKQRDPKDKITPGPCVPGQPEYDINKCGDSIKDK